jgi:uncharacterized protein
MIPRASQRWRRGLLVIFIIGLVLSGWGFVWEPSRLVVRTQALAVPHWPPACAGLRVAVVTDLHVGAPHVGVDKLDHVVATLREQSPDVVLLTGDFVIDGVIGGQWVSPEVIAQHLRPLAENGRAYAVLGNHDWWLDAGRVRRALESAGIPVLEDTSVPMAIDRCRFRLAGISDATEGPHDIAKALSQVAPTDAVLAMTHNPDIFPELPARVSLLVAGHTHGGQVNLPWLGRLVVPSRFGQRYAIGHVVEQGRHLFVGPGIGTSILPVRWRVPPELSVLELTPLPTSPPEHAP